MGTIPSAIGELTSLQSLDLHSNMLSGSIPSVIGALISLQAIYINRNSLVDYSEHDRCINIIAQT